MKISLSEIWSFTELIESSEPGWSYQLVAGNCVVDDVSHDLLLQLKGDDSYDLELLPDIFTFREILWQPDVFKESNNSLPGLRILKAHCDEKVEHYQRAEKDTYRIYCELLNGLATSCSKAIKSLKSNKNSANKVLGVFRTEAFPIIKFFIYHPKNKLEHYRDAVNRLNYAVKVMLTQFNGKYTELADPYWKVNYKKDKNTAVKSPENEEKP